MMTSPAGVFADDGGQLRSPVRNRYFYGKLLDTHHFELETAYLNHKRWLINRLVHGWGVVCGLDVNSARPHEAITVGPGMALDKCGREIIVPRSHGPSTSPPTSSRRLLRTSATTGMGGRRGRSPSTSSSATTNASLSRRPS